MDINVISTINSMGDFRGNEVTFNDRPEVKKARTDFSFVCSQSNYTTPAATKWLAVMKGTDKLGVFLPVPLNLESKITKIPAEYIKLDDPQMYVAVVCYQAEQPVEVLLLNSLLFQKKAKPVSYNKKTGQYIVKIKKLLKFQKYAFGNVIQSV